MRFFNLETCVNSNHIQIEKICRLVLAGDLRVCIIRSEMDSSSPRGTDMTYKFFSLAFLIFAIVAMPTNANAEIITLFDAGIEAPEPGTTNNENDSNFSTINTASVTNSVYDTRSTEIGADTTPHLSGIVPNTGPSGNGLFYIHSSATGPTTNINQAASAYHDFEITVTESQLNLDTLSFNYWAAEGLINDAEADTNYNYEVRALAAKNPTSVNDYNNLSFASTNTGTNTLNIQNPKDDGIPLDTGRFANFIEFDLNSLGQLTAGDVVAFRLAFADYTPGPNFAADPLDRLAGPSDTLHTHRLDNVQITSATAVPEPSSMIVLIGSVGLLSLRRRR